MEKQALVVGLGQFGMSLARALTARGADVLAVDHRPELVEIAAQFAARAVVFDATNEAALAQAAPERRDLCICAIGNEAREASMVCTALLVQMGAPMVVARATDDLHARILRLVGAHVVVNPEQEFGERMATRLMYTRMLGEVPLGKDLLVAEIQAPDAMIGRTLAELALPRRHGVTVVAIRRPHGDRGELVLPSPTDPLHAGDILVVVAPPNNVTRMLERL